MKALFRFLGSLSFALTLLGMLVVLLTVSTLAESAYGTPFAQKIFYNAGWFDLFLGFFAVNILFSALSRWPYKLHHTGFLTTHLGILLLLAGSLMTRLMGVEGQMALMEGEEKSYMLKQDYELTVHEPGGGARHWRLGSFSRLKKPSLPLDHSRRLELERVEEGVVFSPEVRAGGASSPANHAIRFTLKSQMARLDESFWLVEKSSEPSLSSRLSVGMAELELKEGRPSQAGGGTAEVSEPRIRLTQKGTGKELSVRLDAGRTNGASSPEMGLTVSGVTYYPDARVDENNELVNASDTPRNPAVRFTLEDGAGQKEQRVIFSLFPDFDAIHGKKSAAFQDIKVEFLAPRSELASRTGGSGLTFYFSGDAWSYEARSKKGVLTGEVKKGLEQPTGWMDFSFRVDEILSDAVVEKKAVLTGSSKKGDTGALVALSGPGAPAGPQWTVPGQPAHFETPEGIWVVTVGAEAVELPFRLQLIDFRKKDYPGTQNAASYESDAKLQDPAERVTIQKTIWMNHPLDYKGFRIFQSSFVQDPEAGETSIFTIAKNPGIPFIYGGSILMFLGIVFVFYVKPLSYLSTRSSHGASKK